MGYSIEGIIAILREYIVIHESKGKQPISEYI